MCLVVFNDKDLNNNRTLLAGLEFVAFQCYLSLFLPELDL